MPRRPATFTKADLARALAAAADAGPDYAVKVHRDGTLEIYRKPSDRPEDVPYKGEIKLW
jgi:hypothetical protein